MLVMNLLCQFANRCLIEEVLQVEDEQLFELSGRVVQALLCNFLRRSIRDIGFAFGSGRPFPASTLI